MRPVDIVGGVLPTDRWWQVERRQVAEYHELGIRVCSPLHGAGHDNARDSDARRHTIAARCHRAGHRPEQAPRQLALV